MTRQFKNGFAGAIIFVIAFGFAFSAAWAVIDPGKWKEEWGKSKAEYEEMTGKKKPKAGNIFHSAGLDKALAKADNAYEVVRQNVLPTTKSINNFKKAIKAFSKQKDKYLKTLAKAAKKETDQTIVKAMDILKRDLKAIEKNMLLQVDTFEAMAANDPSQVVARITIGTFKDSLAEMKRGLARLRAKPSVDTWNKIKMNRLLRDMQNSLYGCEQSNLDPPGGLKDQFIEYENNSLETIENLIKQGLGTEAEVVETALEEIEKSVKEANRYLKTLT